MQTGTYWRHADRVLRTARRRQVHHREDRGEAAGSRLRADRDSIEQALREAGAMGPMGPEGYLAAYRVADDNLALGLTVVADCVNAAEASRSAWRAVAARRDCRLLFVTVVCSATAEHQRRLEERNARSSGDGLPAWSAVSAMQIEPPPPDALVLDTARLDAEEAADLVVRRAA